MIVLLASKLAFVECESKQVYMSDDLDEIVGGRVVDKMEYFPAHEPHSGLLILSTAVHNQ